MKTKYKTVLIAILLITAPLLMLAQNPPHPNGGSDPGAGNQPVGGSTGAPVGDGVYVLLALAAAYGVKNGKRVMADELMS